MIKAKAYRAASKLSVFVCAVLFVGSIAVTGCKGKDAPMTEAEKANWKGTAPPPGFEKEMEKQTREWNEKHPPAPPPPGVPAPK
ncbi:MAG: hypothetical protein V4671_32010 [Armatimonadota bacterium]